MGKACMVPVLGLVQVRKFVQDIVLVPCLVDRCNLVQESDTVMLLVPDLVGMAYMGTMLVFLQESLLVEPSLVDKYSLVQVSNMDEW
jgi:hypothetical protein